MEFRFQIDERTNRVDRVTLTHDDFADQRLFKSLLEAVKQGGEFKVIVVHSCGRTTIWSQDGSDGSEGADGSSAGG